MDTFPAHTYADPSMRVLYTSYFRAGAFGFFTYVRKWATWYIAFGFRDIRGPPSPYPAGHAARRISLLCIDDGVGLMVNQHSSIRHTSPNFPKFPMKSKSLHFATRCF